MSDPDFELLPGDPLAFFDLEEDFGPRDLKRRYTRLIKRFKPHRDPIAFQKIRAAYEDLLAQGERPSRRVVRAEASVESGDEADERSLLGLDGALPTDSEPAAPAPHRAQALLDRIETHGLARSYELLVSKQPKEPEDYRQLALLADLHPEGPRGFLDWVLAGVRDYPDDEGLDGMLAALCRDGLPDEELGPGLERIAQTLGPSRFYEISGPLWLAFLRRHPFRELRPQWERCETATRRRGLSDVAAPQRLRLLVRLLRAACWRADEAWIRETSEFLSSHHTRLPDDSQAELDFVELIRDYLLLSSREVERSPAREGLNRILRAFCELPEAPFDQVLFHELGELRGEGWDLLAELPPDDPAGGLTVSALEWVSSEAEARRLQAPPTVSERQLVGSLRRLEWQYASDARWRWLSHLPAAGRLLQVLGYLPALLLGVAALVRGDGSLFVVAAALAFAFRFLDQRQHLVERGRRRLLRLTAGLMERLRDRLYLKSLRPGLGEFLLRTRIPARAVANEISRLGEESEWSWDADWLADLVREDAGLTALSLVRRFERP
ncbi:MAG: J domain-containing protein [Planctomycetes bacterium]|nr:J domain-containing protein [Planctomycetota bacterium]